MKVTKITTTSSIENLKRPFALRAINRVGKLANAIKPSRLYFDHILSSARSKSGLSGDLEYDFETPLKVLIEAINSTSKLDFIGTQMARQMLINALSNQMAIRNEFQDDSSIALEKIIQPLFIIGFPRTGTTFLHNLLALDESNRAPKMWEVINPTIVSQLREKERVQRINEAEKFVKFANYLIPQLNTIHPLAANGPDECLKLIENTFISPHFAMYFDIPDYMHWLLSEGNSLFIKVYEYHKKQLQILQKGSPACRWVLKTPLHLFFLEALLNVYPDAMIVNIQRDPLECIPSFCSLVGVNRALFSDYRNMHELGRFSLAFYAESQKRAIAAQQKIRSGALININYRDFTKNPKKTIREIDEYFGLPYNTVYDQKLGRWIGEHPKNKHGAHKYTMSQFGLNEANILQEYSRLFGQTEQQSISLN